MSQPRALYIHVPFCASTCPYCDFNSVTVHDHIDDYVAALCKELRTQAANAGSLHSVFIGGGTPSFLSIQQMKPLLETVRSVFRLEPECEWTIEANPGSTSREKAAAWKAGGVNRVSVGAQSFDAVVLKQLGRRHTPSAIGRAVSDVQEAGIVNVSVDLMYGVPGQSVQSVEDSAAQAVRLGVTHVSAYHLTIEASTPYGIAASVDQLHVPDDEHVLLQRQAIERVLAGAGLTRYEISNYAKPTRESRHNMAYWQYEPYLGCGAGAVGFDGRKRTRNLASVRQYIDSVQAAGSACGSHEELSEETRLFEQVFSGLRLTSGVRDAQLVAHHGRELADLFGDEVGALASGGYLTRSDSGWRLTDRGVPVANEIALRFLR